MLLLIKATFLRSTFKIDGTFYQNHYRSFYENRGDKISMTLLRLRSGRFLRSRLFCDMGGAFLAHDNSFMIKILFFKEQTKLFEVKA